MGILTKNLLVAACSSLKPEFLCFAVASLLLLAHPGT